MICLDTNIIIAAINRRVPRVRERLLGQLASGTIVGIPAIVLFEIWYGIKKSVRQQANISDLSDFLAFDVTAWSNVAKKVSDPRATSLIPRQGSQIRHIVS